MKSLSAIILAVFLLLPPGAAAAPELPPRSEVAGGYTADSVECRLASLPLHDVEGLWRFPGEGSTVAVERIPAGAATAYRMVMVEPADRAVRPGTVTGILTATSKKGVYECSLYTSAESGGVLTSPKQFILTVGADGVRFSLRPRGKKLGFRWWRLLPYMFRYTIYREGYDPDDLGGCVRVFPEPSPPLQPRCL